MPAYADGTPKANKHVDHKVNLGYGCQVCHYTVTTDGATVTGRANHANSTTWTLAPNGAGAALYQFTWVFPNCTATVCHGGNTVAWNAASPIACQVCHSYVGGGVTNTDANDFTWAGGVPTMSKIAYGEYTAASGGHGSAAPRAISKSCNASSCHDSAVIHDTTTSLTGSNPFRLVDQSGSAGVQYGCDYSGAGCHQSGINGPQTGLDLSTIKTHSSAVMTAAGYTPIRTWPAWVPQCTNCHDPHGDANLSMVSRWAYDKAAFNVPAGVGGAPYTGALPTENTTLVFTDATTGANAGGGSYADLDGPYSSVCQECHEDASVVSFHDGTTAAGANHPGTGTNPGDCSSCHRHDSGFMPMGCEGCHNGNVAYPLAPNVIDGTMPGSASLSYNYYGTDGAKQDGGHGDPEGRDNLLAKPECTSCHDISQPAGNLHLNGTYESIWNNTSRNANTAHLKAEFFTLYPANAVGTWSVQVAFDNYCYQKCHVGLSVPVMKHESDTLVSDGNYGSVELGTHLTVATGDTLPYPVDRDLNTAATGVPFYVPCISCHDPHGTTLVETTRTSNRMVRDKWTEPPTLCNTCHY